jgi:hypothetical protein
MHPLFSFFMALLPTAHAVVLDTTGGAAVAGMWATICSFLPYCDMGATFPAFFACKVSDFFFVMISGVAVCAITYGGIKMMAGTGQDSGYEEAKKIVMYAAIGLILAILSKTIIDYVVIDVVRDLVGSPTSSFTCSGW